MKVERLLPGQRDAHVKREKNIKKNNLNTPAAKIKDAKKKKNLSYYFKLFLFNITFMKERMSLLERASVEARFQAGLMQFNGDICGLSSAAWRKHQHGPARNQGRRKRAHVATARTIIIKSFMTVKKLRNGVFFWWMRYFVSDIKFKLFVTSVTSVYIFNRVDFIVLCPLRLEFFFSIITICAKFSIRYTKTEYLKIIINN